jgi:hypothetical protein
VIGKEKIDKVEKLVRGLFSAYTSQQETPRAASTQQIPNVCSVNNDPWTECDKKSVMIFELGEARSLIDI